MYVWHNCKFTLRLCDVAWDCTQLIDNAVTAAALYFSGILLIDNVTCSILRKIKYLKLSCSVLLIDNYTCCILLREISYR